MKKDLVVDLSETWSQWLKRTSEFGEPPLIPREDCPENKLPHRSFYGKIASWSNGMDPYPPKRPQTQQVMADPEESQKRPFTGQDEFDMREEVKSIDLSDEK